MLDITLRRLAFAHDGGFALRELDLHFARSTHTALIGPPSCGASTVLRLVAGLLRPSAGDVILGQRRVNDIRASRRPLLFATSELDVPGRWSVQHALVAAVRTRSLDREDRHREYQLAIGKWALEDLLPRKMRTLSSTEGARVALARIELLRPAVLLADRLLDRVSPAARVSLADAFFRTMRVFGTTVISAPSSREELAYSERVVVLDGGRVVQVGSAMEAFVRPHDEAAALATGEVDAVPIVIRGKLVESAIGAWELEAAPFQGNGVALVRPSDFFPAAPGEESDFVFGIEEAGFANGRWIARGMLSGGLTLRVELPREANVHKGKLLALRYDATRFRLLPSEAAPRQSSVPTDVVPPLAESR